MLRLCTGEKVHTEQVGSQYENVWNNKGCAYVSIAAYTINIDRFIVDAHLFGKKELAV